MSTKWFNSKYPGVRYREHETRIHNRKKDRYFAIRYYRDEKRIEEGLGWISDGMSLDEAQEIRGQIVQNIKKGIKPQSFAEMREIGEAFIKAEQVKKETERRDGVTFGEMAVIFLEWSKNNKKSYQADRYRYEKHLEPRFKDTPLKDISIFHLEKLKSTLKKEELSPASIVQCLQLIRAVFNKTRSWGKHDYIFPAVDFPSVSNQRERFLSGVQVEALLNAVKKRSIMIWCQCVLSLYAGLRFGEIAGLELSDIDEKAGTIHIRDPKSGDDRHAYITEPIKDMFDEWWAFTGRKPGLIFPDQNGKKQVRVSFTFTKIIDELGFNNDVADTRHRIVFHSLRHTFASWMVKDGQPLVLVKVLMGHARVSTTERYSHVAEDAIRTAAHRLVTVMKEKNVIDFKGTLTGTE